MLGHVFAGVAIVLGGLHTEKPHCAHAGESGPRRIAWALCRRAAKPVALQFVHPQLGQRAGLPGGFPLFGNYPQTKAMGNQHRAFSRMNSSGDTWLRPVQCQRSKAS